jgi:hypothetical protein
MAELRDVIGVQRQGADRMAMPGHGQTYSISIS